jgi:hypothetical protein
LSDSANDFASPVSISGGNVILRDANALTFTSLTATGGANITTDGAVVFGPTSVRGNLAVVSGNGAISQTSNMGVSGSASFNAGAGSVDLSNATNVFGATPQIQAASSTVSSGGPYNLASALGTDPQKPIFSGMAPANTTVSLFDNGTLLGTTLADNTGAWRYEPTTFMIPGNHTITANSASALGVSGLSEPLSILVNARFDTPNMVGAVLKTQQTQASVMPPVEGGLKLGQAPVVDANQLSSMSPQQLQAMTPAQTALLSVAQLVSLEPVQIASLSPTQFLALQPQQVLQLAPAQMTSLSGAQVAAITSVAALNFNQLQVLSPEQLASVQPKQFVSMHAAQIASLGDSQLQSLTPLQVSAIAPSNLAAFTLEQISLMGSNLTQHLSPEQFGGLTALQLSSLSESQVSAVTPAQLQQLNPMQLSVLTGEHKAAMTPLQLLAIGEPVSLQVSDLSQRDISSLTVQQVQNLQTEQLQSLSGLQIRALGSEQIESLSFNQLSSLSPVQLQALTTQQLSSMTVAQAAALNDSQLAVMSASQLNALPKGGVLPVVVLGESSGPAIGIEFEKRGDVIDARTTDMVPSSSSSGGGSITTELKVFKVSTEDGQTVEFKGAINGKQLMIAAPSDSAKALASKDLAQVMKVALKQLSEDSNADPSDLSGIVLDLR